MGNSIRYIFICTCMCAYICLLVSFISVSDLYNYFTFSKVYEGNIDSTSNKVITFPNPKMAFGIKVQPLDTNKKPINAVLGIELIGCLSELNEMFSVL